MTKLTASKVSQALDISVITLNNWYAWYMNDEIDKPDDMPELPKYEQAYERATRYWNEEDIKLIKIFQEWIPRGRGGVMGAQSSKYWGDRGKDIKRD